MGYRGFKLKHFCVDATMFNKRKTKKVQTVSAQNKHTSKETILKNENDITGYLGMCTYCKHLVNVNGLISFLVLLQDPPQLEVIARIADLVFFLP